MISPKGVKFRKLPQIRKQGAPRWIYLSAWGYALKQPGGNETKARDLVKKLYQNVKGT